MVSEEATELVLEAQPHVVFGKEVQVKRADSKEDTRKKLVGEKDRKLFVYNIMTGLSKEPLKAYFESFGPITDFRVYFEKISECKVKGYGFVLFEVSSSMKKLLDLGKIHEIEGLTFECK